MGVSGEVHSFEPQRLLFQQLNANLALNSINNVYTYNMAVGSSMGSIALPDLNYNTYLNTGSISLDPEAKLAASKVDEFVRTVPMTTLDNILARYVPRCPSFIKHI